MRVYRRPTYPEMLNECRRQLDAPDGRRLPTPPLPLLITGVTGVAGYGTLAYFQSRFPGQVFGAVQETDVDFPAPDLIYADLRDYAALERLLDEKRIAAILDCAGNCALKDRSDAPMMSSLHCRQNSLPHHICARRLLLHRSSLRIMN